MIIFLMRKRKWEEWRSIMGNEKELDNRMLREMFNNIRTYEIKNINTQKHNDKAMVKIIEEYILKKVEKETKL